MNQASQAQAAQAAPTIGRIVLYCMPDSQERPAIVVRVWEPGNTNLQLQVFTDGTNDSSMIGPNDVRTAGIIWRTSVHPATDPNVPEPGRWRWPPRV